MAIIKASMQVRGITELLLTSLIRVLPLDLGLLVTQVWAVLDLGYYQTSSVVM